MPDGQGSTRQLTAYSTINATNGQVVARYDYAGFGNSITLSGVTANIVSTVILYNGQMWDPTSLTYHLRDREYDPALGRYDSFDQTNISAGDVVDSNLYLYTGSDPVNLDDPTGDMSEGEALVVAGISALLTLTIHSIYTHTTQSGSALAGGQYARSSQQLALAVVDLLSLGFGGGVGGAGPELQAVGSAIQVSQFSINAASQFAWQSLAVFAAGLSSFGGQSYVNRPGANVQDVKSANGSTVRIVGQSGSSSTTDGHEEAIDQLAQQQSQQPGTILIFLQRSLRTATGRAFGNSLIPDAIVVRLTDPNDITQGIKIDLYEVTSKSQTEQYLQEKLANIQKLIPQSMQGNTRVLPPSQ
jgi:RHS repeat-associated protein